MRRYGRAGYNRYQNRPDRFRFFSWGIGALVVVVIISTIIVAVVNGASHATVQKSVTCTVTGKDHSIDKDGNGVYRVYTSGGEECTTFDVADSAWFGNYNSADLYGSLQEGKTYRLETSGIRNGFLSMFPTIRSASEVQK